MLTSNDSGRGLTWEGNMRTIKESHPTNQRVSRRNQNVSSANTCSYLNLGYSFLIYECGSFVIVLRN